jgi:cephalosporin-C deacetylase
MLIGAPREQLEKLQTPLTLQPDFHEFWSRTLKEFLPATPQVTLEPHPSPLSLVNISDVTVAGFNSDPIKGWFLQPHALAADAPCIVMYDGYGGGRGLPHEWLFWANVGYNVLVMDTRGQGGGFRLSSTPDGNYSRGPQTPGFMTSGISDKNDYYYRRVFVDAVAFIEAAQQLPGVNPKRIIVAGGSQGGGIALAAASLSDRVFAAMPDVPFLCNYRKATEIVDTYPYHEITLYCRIHRNEIDAVFNTLSYFDCMNLVTMAKSPALISIGMHDPICPPETIFAMRNHYAGRVDTQIYEFNTHEGGSVEHQLVQAQWIKKLLAESGAA